MVKVFIANFLLSQFILSIYLVLFGHHHQSSAHKIAWKIFLSRNFLSHLRTIVCIYTRTYFFFFRFLVSLIPILLWLCKNTSSCQLVCLLLSTWNVILFTIWSRKKTQFFTFLCCILHWFCGKMRSFLIVFVQNITYHWWGREHDRRKIVVKVVE